MILLLIGLALLGFCGYRFRQDRRRLSNGVYLLLGLIFTGLWMLQSGAPGTEVPSFVIATIALLSPLLVLLLAGFLIVNGVTMLRREGFSVANLLSLVAGLGLLVPYVLLASALLTQRYWLAVVLGSFSLVASYLGFLFTSFLLYSYVYGRQKYQPGMDAIVVHGAGLSGADVTPLLASRLDKAADVFRAEVREGRSPLLVVSGGKGSDEVVSEAEAMCVYLVDRGIPRESVILEDRSTTTLENLEYTRDLLRANTTKPRMVLVTSNFHILRTATVCPKPRSGCGSHRFPHRPVLPAERHSARVRRRHGGAQVAQRNGLPDPGRPAPTGGLGGRRHFVAGFSESGSRRPSVGDPEAVRRPRCRQENRGGCRTRTSPPDASWR